MLLIVSRAIRKSIILLTVAAIVQVTAPADRAVAASSESGSGAAAPASSGSGGAALGEGRYTIRSAHGCPSHPMCNAELSWDRQSDRKAMASVEFDDPVVWELIPKGGQLYTIRSSYGCPSHPMCNAELSWDGQSDRKAMASVEFGDPVAWELLPKGGQLYTIRSAHGCPDHPMCNAELSWDSQSDRKAMASVEFGDPVLWEVMPAQIASDSRPPTAPPMPAQIASDSRPPTAPPTSRDDPSEATAPASPGDDRIEAFFRNLGSWDAFSPLRPDTPPQRGRPTEERTGKYRCTKTPVSLTKTPEKIVTFDPNIGSLFVGNLLEGKGYLEGLGSFRELPIRQRAPLTISINLMTANNTKTVHNPSLSTVQQAIGELVETATRNNVRNQSKISYKSKAVSSLEQVAAEFGFSARYMAGSVKSKFGFSSSAGKNTLMVNFIENMYTVSMELPQTPAALFSDELTIPILQEQASRGRIGRDNLPVFVAGVTYGRMMTYTLTSSQDAQSMEATLNAAYNGGALSLEADVKTAYQKLILESEVELTTVGGDSASARQAIASGDIRQFFTDRNSLQSAAPISYTVHNLSDNSLAKVSETINYTLTECTALTPRDFYQVRGLLHGPGGGPWGTWGHEEMCPTGTFATGFQQKIEAPIDGDDSAMNALKLYCDHSESYVTSTEGPWGNYGPRLKCDEGQALVAYSLKVEAPIDGDDSAGNSIRMYCRDLSQATGTHKNLFPDDNRGIQGGQWGTYGPVVTAPANQAICGISTKVEPKQGDGDDSALNDVRFRLCSYAP